MRADTITLVDNRTGKSYELPVEHGAIRTTDLRQIRTGPDDFGLMTYDPAFMNTAACKSRITYIDGEQGHSAVSRLPDRAARRALHVPGGGVPPARTASCRRAVSWTPWAWEITHHTCDPREHQEVHRRVPLRCASHGDAGLGGRGALDVLPECQEPCRRPTAGAFRLSG